MKTRTRPAPERLGWRKGGREGKGGPEAPSSISFQASTPPNLPAAPGARSEPAGFPLIPKTIPTHPVKGPNHLPPCGPPCGSAGGARSPIPHSSPPVPGPPPERVRSTPPRPASGEPPFAHGEVRPKKRERGRPGGSVRAGNTVLRGPSVRRETERGDQWGWGPKAVLTGSTVAILDRSDRTTAPEGAG